MRGCSLAWTIEGNGPPVVLVQGTGMAGCTWAPQVRALESRFTCLSLDNRGTGDSQPVGETLTVSGMAADVLAAMDAEAWTDAHFIGHSLGGLIALFAAHQAPQRIRSLTLLCTFATGAIPTRMDPWLLRVGMRTRLGTRRMRRHAFVELIVEPAVLQQQGPDVLAAELAAAFGRPVEDPPAVTMQQFRAMRHADARPFLDGLADIPALVVSAREDRIAPPSAGQALAAALESARYMQVEGAHAVPLRSPDRVNAIIVDHLMAVERRRSRTHHGSTPRPA